MDRLNFLTTATTSGESGKYPITLEVLDAMQAQAILASAVARCLGGTYFIIRPSTTMDGIVVIGGEIMPVLKSPLLISGGKPWDWQTTLPKELILVTSSLNENITADGNTYVSARTRRYATIEEYSDLFEGSNPIYLIPVVEDLHKTITRVLNDGTTLKSVIERLSKQVSTLAVSVESNAISKDEIEQLKSNQASNASAITDLDERLKLLEGSKYKPTSH